MENISLKNARQRSGSCGERPIESLGMGWDTERKLAEGDGYVERERKDGVPSNAC